MKRMKLISRLSVIGLLLAAINLFLITAPQARGQNVNVTNSNTHPVPVNVISGGTGGGSVGAANEANSQVIASITAGTLVIARATRVSCLFKNTDASITVYVGAATVTTGNGFPLLPGQSIVVTGQNLFQVIAASGSPVIAIIDEYN